MYLLLAIKQDLRNCNLRNMQIIGAFTNKKNALNAQKNFIKEWEYNSVAFDSSFYWFPVLEETLPLSASEFTINSIAPKHYNMQFIKDLTELSNLTMRY